MADYYVRLYGDNWASRSVAYLAVEILSGIVLLSCLFFVRSFRWVFRGTTDRLRTYLFIASIIATNIYFVLDLSNEGEDEKDAIVSVKYYVLWIFIELFYRLSEFTILVVILRSVNVLAFADYGIPGAARKARLATLAILCFVGVVSLTTFCLVAGYYGNFADANFDELPSLVNVIVGFFVTYNVLYSVAAIYVVVIAAIGIARTRSKMSFIMLLVGICLLLRVVVYLADVIMDYFSDDITSRNNVDWANSFIYNIMIILIYTGVTGAAIIGSGFDLMGKHDPGLELAPFASPHVYE